MIETNNAVPDGIFRTVRELDTGSEREELGQEDFLKLMTTQLENQDPFKPMENGDFLAQIAQFSTVSGIGDLQTSFEKLSDSLVSNQAIQAANLVGHKVIVPTGVVALEQGGDVKGNVELPSASGQVTINVHDNSGQIIRKLELGSQSAGQVSFKWDGIKSDGQFATPGKYLLTAEASFDGEVEALETLVATEVNSVTLNKNGGLLLDLAGIGPIDFSEVRQIL